jgi:flagellin
MPLNVVSNHAANVAHRNLVQTDKQATASLSKLSIGQRVVSARDDAATAIAAEAFTVTGSSALTLAFKLGTGTQTEDT